MLQVPYNLQLWSGGSINVEVETLILPKLKAISLCQQYRARPAWPGSILVAGELKVFMILLSLKIILDSAKNRRLIFPLENVGMVLVRVNAIIKEYKFPMMNGEYKTIESVWQYCVTDLWTAYFHTSIYRHENIWIRLIG